MKSEKRDPRLYLDDILESILLIEEYLKDVSKDDFFSSQATQDAVVRRIEIIGEATKQLPVEFKEKYPEVPWQEMAGMRNEVIHGYFGINYMTVWEAAKDHIPPLKMQIQEILEKEDKLRE